MLWYKINRSKDLLKSINFDEYRISFKIWIPSKHVNSQGKSLFGNYKSRNNELKMHKYKSKRQETSKIFKR